MLDLVLTVPGTIALSPVLAAIVVLVRVKLGSPVLFRQTRPGKNGKPFELVKFRTMTSACDDQGRLLDDDERLTRFGALLRATSLDELPELLNVLAGDMSLVGPRPLLTRYQGRYTPEQARRHAVRPGITGWAQVNGRNAISWEDKFRLDVEYVNNLSMAMDLRILLKTVVAVLDRRGISAEGHKTMPEFMGSKQD